MSKEFDPLELPQDRPELLVQEWAIRLYRPEKGPLVIESVFRGRHGTAVVQRVQPVSRAMTARELQDLFVDFENEVVRAVAQRVGVQLTTG